MEQHLTRMHRKVGVNDRAQLTSALFTGPHRQAIGVWRISGRRPAGLPRRAARVGRRALRGGGTASAGKHDDHAGGRL
ncbi:hypothetical protein ACIRL2_04895 [Embleya sp. NPDC127516]|uniref:hypothetical protein n=1 Tax=Embleya sp. NPDC127516 TaxID=3363990 RepID=UPI00382BB113